MANITIRNLPDAAYERLKLRAQENRRSLNQEIVTYLERAAEQPTKSDTEAFLDDLRKFHKKLKSVKFTAREISKAKRQGRP